MGDDSLRAGNRKGNMAEVGVKNVLMRYVDLYCVLTMFWRERLLSKKRRKKHEGAEKKGI